MLSRRRQWHPTPVLLPGKSHGWRSLEDCSPWCRWGSDTTWVTSLSLFTFMHWRRQWQPLQCSCLENPRDGGAWWAAVYGVAQSQTWLKQLSRLVIALLPRSKRLFNFTAAVAICSDFGAQENKVCHCFHCFPIYLPWSDGTRCHDLHFLNVEF